ncbi:MAG: cell division protein FtsZ [Bacteroidetes bacterium]|nr:MAG: cell division protein FtsZ [Bacteroidota bacterium]
MMFDMPKYESPIIKVLGVGGGGSNAVSHMYDQGIVGVDFAICNTDSQAMETSPVPTKIQLGPNLTEGRGAGSMPNKGKAACEESIEDVRRYLEDKCKMLFITAGMGGGTGTGAAPIIAKLAKEMGILTVGIVTLPFTFEGRRRSTQGNEGLAELKKYVDTLIVISNDKLRSIFGNLSLSDAFGNADNILSTAAKGIAEIITVPGYVNVDFEDVNTVMRDSGVAIMGTAVADGDDRARRAVDEALHSPLLEDNNIKGAKHILLNITSGTKEVTMDEIFEITEFVQEEAGYGTDLIWGNCYDENLGEKLCVTVIATGFEEHSNVKKITGDERIVVSLDDDSIERRPVQNTNLSDVGIDTNKNDDPSMTFEFDDVREAVKKAHRKSYSYDEPYVNEEEKARMMKERNLRFEREKRRRESLMQDKPEPKLNNPQTINELENEPAYLRRGVRLDDVPTSSENTYSTWSLTEGEEADIQENGNSFLHDNVD